MADAQKESANLPSGNDWEFVSLTASTYAAAPGPKLPPDEKKDGGFVVERHGSAAAMFMSGHFKLPVDEPENLLKEPGCKGVSYEVRSEDYSPAMKGVTDRANCYEESCKSKLSDDMSGIGFLDKQKDLSVDELGFGEAKALKGLGLVDEETAMFRSSGFNIFCADSEISRSAHHSAASGVFDPVDPSCPVVDASVGTIVVPVPEDNGTGESDLPCEVWWKRKFSGLYNNAKEAKTFWSIFVAATIVGLAILGQRWQREKLQHQQFRLQFNVDSEKISCSVGPLSPVKSTYIGGNEQSPLVHGYGALGGL